MAVQALRKCDAVIVRTSLIGSILSNLLMVLGAAFLAGGATRVEQNFNITAAQTAASLLTVSCVAGRFRGLPLGQSHRRCGYYQAVARHRCYPAGCLRQLPRLPAVHSRAGLCDRVREDAARQSTTLSSRVSFCAPLMA